MNEKDFLRKLAKDKKDFLQSFIDILHKDNIRFCVIGGLAVNAYTSEPVVSLDLDVVVSLDQLDRLRAKLQEHFKVEDFYNSINVIGKDSDFRIQLKIDERYQDFLAKASVHDILGYAIPVAAIEDVFQGKIWAAMDRNRRPSKRQKDLSDILRLMEGKKELADSLPDVLRRQLMK